MKRDGRRPDLEIDRLQGTKGAFHVAEPLVGAHRIRRVEPLAGHAGPNDIQAVERRFGGQPRRIDFEREPIVLKSV
jgi:hypothetical protein